MNCTNENPLPYSILYSLNSSLLLEFNLPFISPYYQLQSFNLNHPTISGPLKLTTPLIKPENARRTVINLTNTELTTAQTELLSLGLKFSPTEVKPNIATIASKIEPSTRSFDPAIENAIANDIAYVLQTPSPLKPNLKPHQSAALKSLQKQKNTLKITRADKGNATVIMTQDQYNKILEHLDMDCYTPLKKDPTDSLTRKLDMVLKKLLKENKINKPFYNSCRTMNPRRPQLYGLPKIHKSGNPIRPIVSFYNTPLSALHKQLSYILKPLTISPLRLKDSYDFVDHLSSSSDPDYSYYCSLDVKSLYTSCDMRLAAKTVLDKLHEDSSLLPDNVTVDAVYTLLNFSLDNSYFQYSDKLYKQTTGGPMGSPLTIALAEIRVTETEQLALNTSSKPPKYYRHFVDDGFGHFTDKQNATDFLKHINGLTNDLQYTIEYPAANGSIPYLDVLIHCDNTTSVYRKPIHTDLYTHYSLSTPQSSKNSVISSLTRRAHNICSPCHLEAELQIIKDTLLCNGFPLNRINLIMTRTQKNLKTKKSPKKKTTTSANILIPFPRWLPQKYKVHTPTI